MSNKVIYENMPDNDLVLKVNADNDSNALKELVNRHTGIYNKIVGDFTNSQTKHMSQDYIDDKYYTFYKAVKNFDPNRNMKFHVYLGQTIKFNCMRDAWNMKDAPKMETIEEINEKLDERENYSFDDSRIIKIAYSINHDFGEILSARLSSTNDKLVSVKSVAQKLGKKVSTTRNIYNKYIPTLRTILKNEEFNS